MSPQARPTPVKPGPATPGSRSETTFRDETGRTGVLRSRSLLITARGVATPGHGEGRAGTHHQARPGRPRYPARPLLVPPRRDPAGLAGDAGCRLAGSSGPSPNCSLRMGRGCARPFFQPYRSPETGSPGSRRSSPPPGLARAVNSEELLCPRDDRPYPRPAAGIPAAARAWCAHPATAAGGAGDAAVFPVRRGVRGRVWCRAVQGLEESRCRARPRTVRRTRYAVSAICRPVLRILRCISQEAVRSGDWGIADNSGSNGAQAMTNAITQLRGCEKGETCRVSPAALRAPLATRGTAPASSCNMQREGSMSRWIGDQAAS